MLRNCVSFSYHIPKTTLLRALSTTTYPRGTVFKHESTFRLLNNYVVIQMCRFPFLVRNSTKLTRAAYKVLGKSVTNFAVKNTIAKVFAAGENLDDLAKNMEALEQANVYAIADLSIEDVDGDPEEVLDNNKKQIMGLVKLMNDEESHTMSLKVTALTYLKTLKELSEAQKKLDSMFTDIAGFKQNAYITKDQVKDYAFRRFRFTPTQSELDEFFSIATGEDQTTSKISASDYYMNVHAFPIDPKFNSAFVKKVANFSPKTYYELQMWVDRILTIMEELKKSKTYCMIDAQQTYIQSGVDSVTRQLQQVYNINRPLIVRTVQAYLKDSKRMVLLALAATKKRNQPFAVKLVRGAYMTEERRIAKEQGLESPILPTKAEVDKNYNELISIAFKEMTEKSHFNISSHNEDSIKLALKEADKNKKKMETRTISFGQLKGLGDNLTYGLAKKGEYVFKYLPYGPMECLIPYLLRRAEEANYIFEEGKKQVKELNAEIFGARKLHLKAGAMLASLLILGIILKKQNILMQVTG
eukprot:TRINITY_DN1969_c0_g1_i1.p2 TRINITY_DN1969_c0_g1~~TRINITY_DN1969_c0_g1_i1.p2  ORF type:complete len:528 (+),score=60.85 TRINITY_DN1969_c0_g1_i1:5237-6820(+)